MEHGDREVGGAVRASRARRGPRAWRPSSAEGIRGGRQWPGSKRRSYGFSHATGTPAPGYRERAASALPRMGRSPGQLSWTPRAPSSWLRNERATLDIGSGSTAGVGFEPTRHPQRMPSCFQGSRVRPLRHPAVASLCGPVSGRARVQDPGAAGGRSPSQITATSRLGEAASPRERARGPAGAADQREDLADGHVGACLARLLRPREQPSDGELELLERLGGPLVGLESVPPSASLMAMLVSLWSITRAR